MKKRHRWQDQSFYLTPMYKYALGEIITQHKQLSPKVKHTARAILAEFHSDDKIPRNLEALARDKCGISIRTFREHRAILEDAGIFRFDTPPYWKRNQADFAVATMICFPTKRAQKWLRDNGFLEASGKRDRWIEKSACAATTSQKPVANGTGLYQEVAALPASAAANAAASPGLATQGAKFWDEDTDEEFWVAATQDHPEGLDSEYALGASVVNHEDLSGTIVGFPVEDADTRLEGHVLVRFEEGNHVVVDWSRADDLAVTAQSVTLSCCAPLAISTRVTGRGFKGLATVCGHTKAGDAWGDVLVCPDSAPSVKITCWSRELVPVSKADVAFPTQEHADNAERSPVSTRTAQSLDR